MTHDMADLSSYLADTLRSRGLQSAVPEAALVEECCIGIDEAGRGPVLGIYCSNSSLKAIF